MELGLRDRVALVTGGSSGIGQATALALGAEGARVALTYHHGEEAAIKAIAEVEEAGGEAIHTRLDLADRRSIDAALDQVRSTWGGIDVLVSNAVDWPPGRWPPDFTTVPEDSWRHTLRANLEGVFGLIQHAIPIMRGRDLGRIVFVSSGVVEYGMAGEEAYGAAKSALHGFMRSLAREFGPEGMLVNTVMPGMTLTERCLTQIPEGVRTAVAEQAPSRRLSTPEEVAAAIVFLASAANGNITGEILRVSGGS